MRRKDREVTDLHSICDIIDCCKVFRVAAAVENQPYLVPLNFGYTYKDNQFIFCFHCADTGKKLDMFSKNDTVCFEMDCSHQLTTAETACGYGYQYQSVVGMGRVAVVTHPQEKIQLLKLLMQHQTGKDFAFTEQQAAAVTVCRIDVLEISAKQRLL